MNRLSQLAIGVFFGFAMGACTTLDQRVVVPGVTWPGTWVLTGGGESIEITLFENGQVASPTPGTRNGLPGRRGFWRVDGVRVMVALEDGSELIFVSKRGRVLWTDDASRSSRQIAATQQANQVALPAGDYCGIWRLEPQPDGRFLYAVLFADGSAANSIPGAPRGKWISDRESAVVQWSDGWLDRLTRTDRGARKESFAPGSGPDASAVDTTLAIQVGRTPFEISP